VGFSQVLFPVVLLIGLTGLLVGILQSYEHFTIPAIAPAVWNLVIVAALMAFAGRRDAEGLALAAAWGAVVGSAAQLAVQLPTTLRLARNLRPANLAFRDKNVGTVFRNFMPAFVSRGVVQISAYVDQLLASLLPIGAVAALGYAQTLYTLPVSLFGMAISAAELPAMSSALGAETEISRQLYERLHTALRRVAFLIVPSAVAFAALGDVVTAAIYQTGRFGRSDVLYVWSLLAASAVGLLASTLGRLYASTWYALRDASRPLRFALVRLAFGTALGIVFAFRAPGWLGLDPRWGAAGLPLGSGLAGWLEVALLRRSLVARVGRVEIGIGFACRLWGAALVAAAAARAGKLAAPGLPPLLGGIAILALYGVLYFAGSALLGIRESHAFLRGLRASVTRRRYTP